MSAVGEGRRSSAGGGVGVCGLEATRRGSLEAADRAAAAASAASAAASAVNGGYAQISRRLDEAMGQLQRGTAEREAGRVARREVETAEARELDLRAADEEEAAARSTARSTASAFTPRKPLSPAAEPSPRTFARERQIREARQRVVELWGEESLGGMLKGMRPRRVAERAHQVHRAPPGTLPEPSWNPPGTLPEPSRNLRAPGAPRPSQPPRLGPITGARRCTRTRARTVNRTLQ